MSSVTVQHSHKLVEVVAGRVTLVDVVGGTVILVVVTEPQAAPAWSTS